SAEAGLPEINVAPNQGKLLHLLVGMCNAARILEVGTLGGYSAIWMARALPVGGSLVTLELDSTHAAVARANFIEAGVDSLVTLREGAALDTMRQLINEGIAPFDLIFIDADKANIPDYFSMAVELAHVGTVIIVDNVVRKGEVINEQSTDPNVIGVRRFNERVAAEPRVSATALQTVGTKGYDGLVIMRVVGRNSGTP
ncbi:MAG: O-methyltransferase, partial [Gemmatimonadota bacterium]|nr:O-methyltransferase [Gemmatimonadota bacterium]